MDPPRLTGPLNSRESLSADAKLIGDGDGCEPDDTCVTIRYIGSILLMAQSYSSDPAGWRNRARISSPDAMVASPAENARAAIKS